ncbi:hypothetical protein [Pontiella agarivorans]|uniref:Uncharacterized protein n=1 Tax=Pontiella agarivorans TaxID=3038953 RepID=A0ABU5N1E4_9BACT|nr:hypothetical protein [Pontiella agarivorans]MDZ8120247.1 hypothetical protein [Pontiella agarivorans]
MERLDPNLSFTPTVEAEFGAANVAVVYDAQGGQPIREWYKQWTPLQGDEPKATGKLYASFDAKSASGYGREKL